MGAHASPGLSMARAEVLVERKTDGAIVLRSSQALQTGASSVSEWVARFGREAPGRVFLAERNPAGGWRELTYGQASEQMPRLSQGLLDADLGPSRPLMILSENSIDHALLALAAMHVGIPVVPVSVAYSLVDRSLGKLRHIAERVRPGMVFASDSARYAAALEAVGAPRTDLQQLQAVQASERVDQAHRGVGPDTLAKILFTSGSTDHPKGVLNTQRMLTASQQQSLQVWQFVADEPPVVVDWLPWNHTFGGNYNFNLVLSNGGTMLIDAGKPLPGQFEASLRNLREVAPTMYFNVPRGFDLLLPALAADVGLRRHFFSRCRFGFYAAAALPQNLFDAFLRMGREERDGDFALVSAWGSTETAPLCTAVHFPIERTGLIGLPVPGCEIKLVPSGGKYEARVRGPNVTPGYLQDPEKTAAAFDEEGFYRMGDALDLADPAAPGQGLLFAGRIAEDFKLSSGTWVSVGKLRLELLAAAADLVQDAVIAGHGRDEVGALLFLNPVAIAKHDAQSLRVALQAALQALAASAPSASSQRIVRALVLPEPPSMERGEITDKGYLNQRFVLEGRRSDVDRLYAAPTDPQVILL